MGARLQGTDADCTGFLLRLRQGITGLPQYLQRVSFASSVTSLTVELNLLSSLHGVGCLPNLTVLNARQNLINRVPPDLRACSRLRELYLSDNSLEHICCGDLPPSLQVLDLSNNRIAAIDDGAFAGSQLRVLDISRNSLWRLPLCLGFLAGLKHLFINDNAWDADTDMLLTPWHTPAPASAHHHIVPPATPASPAAETPQPHIGAAVLGKRWSLSEFIRRQTFAASSFLRPSSPPPPVPPKDGVYSAVRHADDASLRRIKSAPTTLDASPKKPKSQPQQSSSPRSQSHSKPPLHIDIPPPADLAALAEDDGIPRSADAVLCDSAGIHKLRKPQSAWTMPVSVPMRVSSFTNHAKFLQKRADELKRAREAQAQAWECIRRMLNDLWSVKYPAGKGNHSRTASTQSSEQTDEAVDLQSTSDGTFSDRMTLSDRSEGSRTATSISDAETDYVSVASSLSRSRSHTSTIGSTSNHHDCHHISDNNINNGGTLTPTSETSVETLATLPIYEHENALTRRYNIVIEILATERRYVADLYSLVTLYFQPLAHTDILKAHQLYQLFGNCETLLRIHTEFLHDLEDAIQTDSSTIDVALPSAENTRCVVSARIGRVFNQYLKLWKLYRPFIENVASGMELEAQLSSARTESEKASPKFGLHHDLPASAFPPLSRATKRRWRRFCEQARQNLLHTQSDLKSFLILPVQRLPRYRLLLESLLKVTPLTHVDHGDLCVALLELQQRIVECNEWRKQAEERREMERVCGQIRIPDVMPIPAKEDLIRISRPSRTMVAKFDVGAFAVVPPSVTFDQPCRQLNVSPDVKLVRFLNKATLVVFNDVLCWCWALPQSKNGSPLASPLGSLGSAGSSLQLTKAWDRYHRMQVEFVDRAWWWTAGSNWGIGVDALHDVREQDVRYMRLFDDDGVVVYFAATRDEAQKIQSCLTTPHRRDA